MSVLRSIEQKIEGLFEGLFGRAFRTNVQPVELARKLVKEMEDHRTVSVSRVYVPNEYTVYLSTVDREQFADYESSLRVELQDYLAEHARREGYVLLTPPNVLIETDDDLSMGEFGIATRMVQGDRPTQAAGAAAAGRARCDDDLPAKPPLSPDVPAGEVALAQEIVTLTSRRQAPRAHQPPGRDRSLEGLRHPARRPERLAPARRAPAGGRGLLARRPRLDERLERQRAADGSGRSSTPGT